MKVDAPCPVCGERLDLQWGAISIDGSEAIHLPPAIAGADDWTSYVLLTLMEREWVRSDDDAFERLPPLHRPSAKAVIVVLFWAFFENLVQRLLDAGTKRLPLPVAQFLFKKHKAVGDRLQGLYEILWATTFWKDMDEIGEHQTAQQLRRVQSARNDFVHGKPEAIDSALVETAVDLIPRLIDAWVKVYNRRCAFPPTSASS